MENDLISRSALGIGKCNPEVFENKAYADGWNSAIAVIENAPTIDAVEVCRCKDCKHKRHLQGATDEANVCGLGWGLSGIIAEEDFCSYGKRREENETD